MASDGGRMTWRRGVSVDLHAGGPALRLPDVWAAVRGNHAYILVPDADCRWWTPIRVPLSAVGAPQAAGGPCEGRTSAADWCASAIDAGGGLAHVWTEAGDGE